MILLCNFFFYYGKFFEHERLVEMCLVGISSVLEYKDIKNLITMIWESGIVQAHITLYKSKKQNKAIQEYKYKTQMLYIIGNMTCTEITYTDLLDKSGCLDIVYDTITDYFDEIDVNTTRFKSALWILSNIAIDSSDIISRLINTEKGVYYQVLSIMNRESLSPDLMTNCLNFISNSICYDNPQIYLRLVDIKAIEIISSIMSDYNLQDCINIFFMLIKCGEDLINAKFYNHNIMLFNFISVGLTEILEKLIIRATKEETIFMTRKLIHQLKEFEEIMSYGSSMDII